MRNCWGRGDGRKGLRTFLPGRGSPQDGQCGRWSGEKCRENPTLSTAPVFSPFGSLAAGSPLLRFIAHGRRTTARRSEAAWRRRVRIRAVKRCEPPLGAAPLSLQRAPPLPPAQPSTKGNSRSRFVPPKAFVPRKEWCASLVAGAKRQPRVMTWKCVAGFAPWHDSLRHGSSKLARLACVACMACASQSMSSSPSNSR